MTKYIFFHKKCIFKCRYKYAKAGLAKFLKNNSINRLFKSLYVHILICIALVVKFNYNYNFIRNNSVSKKLITFNNQK